MERRQLPYKTIGGIVPCPGGWLIVPARLAGVTVNVEDPVVYETLAEVLDYKPAFEAAAIYAPIGLFNEPQGAYRPCDEEGRKMVGWPRRAAFRAIPSRAALHAATRDDARALEPWLTNADLRGFKWLREAEREFQPFHQRFFFAAHPDLSFSVLNDDQALTSSPYQLEGVLERMELIRNKLPGVEDVITRTPPAGAAQIHVLQATGLVWTARRAAGRAMSRLPMDPEWDSAGLRMELAS